MSASFKRAVINRALLNPAIWLLILAEKQQRVDDIYPETAPDIVGMLWLTHPFNHHMDFRNRSFGVSVNNNIIKS